MTAPYRRIVHARPVALPAPAVRCDPPPVDTRPTNYKVICISIYTVDLERLDAMVDQLKERGLTKASRSALIRLALDGVDLSLAKKGL